MRVLMPLLRSLIWLLIYRMKVFLYHCPMIIIVSGYNLGRKSSMANTDQREWVPTSLCENTNLYFPKGSVPYLSYLVVILEVIYVLNFIPRPWSLVWHVLFLGIIPVWWCFLPIFAPGRGLWSSKIVSLWHLWLHFSECIMLGLPYQPYGGSLFRVEIHDVFCKIIYPISEGCVCVRSPL